MPIRDFLEGDGMTIGKTGLRIEPTVTLGNLMNAIPLFVMVVGGLWWLMTFAGRADATEHALNELKDSVKTQFTELRRDATDNLKIIQSQIANLPTQAARLEQVERTIIELRQADRDAAERLTKVEAATVETRERVNRLDAVPVRQTR